MSPQFFHGPMESKMKRSPALVYVALAVVAVFASLEADAAEEGIDRYGSLATSMPYDTEIRLTSDTKRIAVWRLQTVRFVTAEGRTFTWRFDGMRALDSFPLARIAPAEFPAPAGATVSINGEIPVSDR
jgi:hypothetical protein